MMGGNMVEINPHTSALQERPVQETTREDLLKLLRLLAKEVACRLARDATNHVVVDDPGSRRSPRHP
jgi:hypothetical protein